MCRLLLGAVLIGGLLAGGCTAYRNGVVDTVEALNKRELKTCGEVRGAVTEGIISGMIHTVFGTGGVDPTQCADVLSK